MRVPSLLDAVKTTMTSFMKSNPELFFKLYPVPEEHRNENWFDYVHGHLPGDKVCSPYDPLLVMAMSD